MDSSDNAPVIKKRCNKCGEESPATPEYFYSHKGHGDGFATFCKQCARDAQYKSRSIAQAVTPDKMKIYYREYRKINREKVNQSERERGKRRRKKYALERLNPDSLRRESERRYRSEYRRRNSHTVIAYSQHRRARIRTLPARWNGQDWERCLDYWHCTCAVCGGQLRDLFGEIEPHADHWIPLNYKGADNPGTVPENMICLCNKCNLSKQDKLPDEWLIGIHSKRKANEILERIAAYFEYMKGQGN